MATVEFTFSPDETEAIKQLRTHALGGYWRGVDAMYRFNFSHGEIDRMGLGITNPLWWRDVPRARREAWLKTPRGMRWQRRCAEIEEQRRTQARYVVVEHILASMPVYPGGEDDGDWDERSTIEWLYDNGYLNEETLWAR